MAGFIRIAVAAFLPSFCLVQGSRVEEVGHQNSSSVSDCVDQVRGARHCVVVKGLQGGAQATTNQVNIDGKEAVMKQTTDDVMKRNLNKEREIVKHLQSQKFEEMPEYYLNYEAAQSDSAVLVMEFLEGWFDLQKGRKEFDAEPKWKPCRLAAFFLALEHLHMAGVSHCDVNAGNVMFKRGDPSQVKLIDFGMAELHRGNKGGCISMAGLPDLFSNGGVCQNICPAFGRLCDCKDNHAPGAKRLEWAETTLELEQCRGDEHGKGVGSFNIGWSANMEEDAVDARAEKAPLESESLDAFKTPVSGETRLSSGVEIAVKIGDTWKIGTVKGQPTKAARKTVIDFVSNQGETTPVSCWHNNQNCMVK